MFQDCIERGKNVYQKKLKRREQMTGDTVRSAHCATTNKKKKKEKEEVPLGEYFVFSLLSSASRSKIFCRSLFFLETKSFASDTYVSSLLSYVLWALCRNSEVDCQE
jgi:hypothetical protein